tara:strand:- start:27829 stop:28167 length:339 start_codon:yes stop_codon:yes gene_type:complete
MENLKPTLEYIINQFNDDCSDLTYRNKLAKRLENLKKPMLKIEYENGSIKASCKQTEWTLDGNYKITISRQRFFCSCLAFQTSKIHVDLGSKKPCKHLIFVACSVALHMAKQ